MKRNLITGGLSLLTASAALLCAVAPVQAADKKPNIVFIMGDDIGMWNIGAYNRGMMAGRTPNLDKLAKQGMLFTDYYAEASCTAGRANFITGELPIRTGMTTVGQAGAQDLACPPRPAPSPQRSKRRAMPPASSARTILATRMNSSRPSTASTSSSATSITSTRWKTRRIRTTRRTCLDKVVARATWSIAGPPTRTMPPRCRAGARSANRRSKTPARSIPNGWKPWTTKSATFAISFIDKAKKDGKPFFCWLNPTRMHIVTHLSPKWEATRNSENGWSEQEAGMAQLDNDIGIVLQKIKDMGEDDNTIVVFTTDNGTESLHLARRRHHALRPVQRGPSWKAASAFRASLRWPGHSPGGHRAERHLLRLGLVPHLPRRRRESDHHQ